LQAAQVLADLLKTCVVSAVFVNVLLNVIQVARLGQAALVDMLSHVAMDIVQVNTARAAK
jgi:hypothetical protein